MDLEPRVTRPAPAQVLLHDPMHRSDVTAREAECDGEGDFVTRMQDTSVIPEPHVLPIDNAADALFVQQLGRLEHLLDEHGALALWRGR